MRFYIGSKIENMAQVRELRDLLVAGGWEPSYDWTAHGSVRGKDGPYIRRRLIETALAETHGVVEADVVIILLPGGRGTHTELGLAIAAPYVRQADTRLWLWSPDAELIGTTEATSVFYHHTRVRKLVAGISMSAVAAAVLADPPDVENDTPHNAIEREGNDR